MCVCVGLIIVKTPPLSGQGVFICVCVCGTMLTVSRAPTPFLGHAPATFVKTTFKIVSRLW